MGSGDWNTAEPHHLFRQPQRRGNGCLVHVNVRQFRQRKGFALTPAHDYDGQSRVMLTHRPRNAGRRLRMGERHHHYSAPNRSRLGVSISGVRRRRGVPGHSACAASRRTRGHDAIGSPLFRPIFSRNLRQLLRRGTRTRPCVPATCARAIAIGCPANLEQESITPTRPPRRASSTTLRVAA